MSMMLTFRAVSLAALMVSVALLGACSREQQDWRSAEASDTVQGYGEFLQRHPESELATEARTRVAQLSEDREWQGAGTTDTADAYKQFLAQHPNGKWAQEARIRIENFALGREGPGAAPGVSAAVAGDAAGDVGSVSGSSVGSPWRGSSGNAAQALPGDAAHGMASTGASAAAAGSSIAAAGASPATVAAPLSPGEPRRPPSVAQMPAGGSAQAAASMSAQASPADLPRAQTSPQALPGAAAVASGSALSPTPAPGSAQASPTLATAWRSDDGFGVQLGAFASENAATTEWQQLTGRFSSELRGLAPRVVSANTSTGHLFRLQALVADEAAARALCDMLKKQSQACVPVLPH
jgi:hypothetical protein